VPKKKKQTRLRKQCKYPGCSSTFSAGEAAYIYDDETFCDVHLLQHLGIAFETYQYDSLDHWGYDRLVEEDEVINILRKLFKL
jgi:hypothetical protein